MIRAHHPDCDCPTCEQHNLGAFAYREIAEELASDDPTVIDPIWRARCQARIDDLKRRCQAPTALCLLLPPEPHHAAA